MFYKFKDTKYGNLTGMSYDDNIFVNNVILDLETLEGSPKKVNGSFNCSINSLLNLEYSPQEVKGDFSCSYNKLTSLKNGPKIVEKNYYCDNNKLISLEGSPKEVKGDFFCNKNNLKTLDGSPEIVKGMFNCSDNELENLKGRPKIIEGDFIFRGNIKLKNLNKIILEIKENNIKAKRYIFDGESITFKELKQKIFDEKLDKKDIHFTKDYGLGI